MATIKKAPAAKVEAKPRTEKVGGVITSADVFDQPAPVVPDAPVAKIDLNDPAQGGNPPSIPVPAIYNPTFAQPSGRVGKPGLAPLYERE